MKKLGSLLMAIGVLVGLAAGIWVAVGVQRGGLPWLVAVGLVKLTIVTSFALLAAGAMLARIKNRQGPNPAAQIAASGSQQDHEVRSIHSEQQGALASRQSRAGTEQREQKK
jgi:hypothetical protein